MIVFIGRSSSSKASWTLLEPYAGQSGLPHEVQGNLLQPHHGFTLLLVERERHHLTDGRLNPGIKEDLAHNVGLDIQEIPAHRADNFGGLQVGIGFDHIDYQKEMEIPKSLAQPGMFFRVGNFEMVQQVLNAC